MDPLRIAVVGVGANENSRARGYLETIRKLTDFYSLCALCDRTGPVLSGVGEQFRVKALYDDAERMLSSEKPDVLFVLVPTDGQTAIALTAAHHKVNIITEIPAAITLSLADELDTACRENGLKWEIAENVWRWPQEQLKQQIVADGLLGELTHARLSYASGSYHGINAIRMILSSEARRVMGYAAEVKTQPYTSVGGELLSTRWWEGGIIEFSNGVTCLYEMPTPGARGSHWEIEGTHGYLSGGELVLYRDPSASQDRRGELFRQEIQFVNSEIDGESVLDHVRVDTSPPVVWKNPFRRHKISSPDDVAKASILYSMYRAITESADPEYGMANARKDMELWFAVRESARLGNQWVELPLAGETQLERQFLNAYQQRYGHSPLSPASLLQTDFDRTSVIWTEAGWL